MWRAIVFGCVLTLATAPAGEHSPGNALNNDGGSRDRRVWRERHWQERREDWLPVPRYQPRYVIPSGPGMQSLMTASGRSSSCDREIACRRRDGADCLRVGAPVAGPPLYL